MTIAPKIRRALLIDDDENAFLLSQRIVDRTGLIANMRWFEHAEDALAFLKSTNREDIDAIFLDINMPGMGGFEFLAAVNTKLSTELAKTVIVMLATSIEPKDIERARNFDIVSDYLEKPLTREKLQHVVSLVVAQRS